MRPFFGTQKFVVLAEIMDLKFRKRGGLEFFVFCFGKGTFLEDMVLEVLGETSENFKACGG